MKRGFNNFNRNNNLKNSYFGSNKNNKKNLLSKDKKQHLPKEKRERHIEISDNISWRIIGGFEDDSPKKIKRELLSEKIKKPFYIRKDGVKVYKNKFGREYVPEIVIQSYQMSGYTYYNSFVVR